MTLDLLRAKDAMAFARDMVDSIPKKGRPEDLLTELFCIKYDELTAAAAADAQAADLAINTALEVEAVEAVFPDGRMTPKAAAAYLGRASTTMAGWRHYGVGPAFVTVNTHVYYFRAELDRYIAAGGTPRSSPGLKALSAAAAKRRRHRKARSLASSVPDDGELSDRD